MKKYELTAETKEIGGVTLHRIRALIDIPEHDVKAGDLGGWIEAERNLSQKGAAWVADEARVMGEALVMDSALVTNSACVMGNALVADSARAMGKALVTGAACVMGKALVTDLACVTGSAWVTGKACVMGKARVTGKERMTGNALVMKSSDCITIGAIGSRNDTTTFYRGADGKIYVSCGCFNGTIDDFAAEVKQVHAGTKHERTYLLAIELAKAQMNVESEVNK